jgi:hypothetical protein
MQNNDVCPNIPEELFSKLNIIKMAQNIGMHMDPMTLEDTMKELSSMAIKCPVTSGPVVPLVSSEPVVPEREGRTLPLSSKSILGTRAASGIYGRNAARSLAPVSKKRGRDQEGGTREEMMNYMYSFIPSNEPGPDAARNLTRLVRMSILAIPTYLIVGGYFMETAGYKTLSAGINAVFSGECTNLTTRIYSAFGLGNPICDNYNSMMATIYRAMNFNGVDMAIVGSSLGFLLATPALFNSFVALLTSLIAHSLKNAHTMNINDATLTVLAANASSAWTDWITLTTNSQAKNIIPPRVALAAGVSQDTVAAHEAAQALAEAQVPDQADQAEEPAQTGKRPRRGGTKRKTRKSKRNSRKSKVTKRKTKRLNKKLSRKTKHGKRKKARKTKKYN